MEQKHTYQIQVKGLVQGVGFRPFIYRLAMRLGLKGSVDNRVEGVCIYVNANQSELLDFLKAIRDEKPQAAEVYEVRFHRKEETIFGDFRILKSRNNVNADELTEISPDIAVCKDCLQDMKMQSHRIDFPLINCTHCGPRFSIIKALPYDRDFTTMKVFKMCDRCRTEYTSVLNRRFHAQPVACNDCGPKYSIYENAKQTEGIPYILSRLAALIEEEKVIALKGLGGFHLMCDAQSKRAVDKLRSIKVRDSKPFAVMFRDLESARKYAVVDEAEAKALESWQRPIVLLEDRKALPPSLNSNFSKIGGMLPYMPFHYLMFEVLNTDVVVLTSGNRSEEPIVIDNQKMIQTFEKQVAAIITYNREIHNRVDDSVMQKVGRGMQLIRRSRSFAPQSFLMPSNVNHIVAVGAELLNTFAVGRGRKVFLSQHIGDLKNAESLGFFEESMKRFQDLFRVNPQLMVCDKHPDYLSSKYAHAAGIQLLEVQHHHAHMASCMVENKLNERLIGIVFDGTGLGDDGNIWGGEFFVGNLKSYERFAHFQYIALPGGDQVTKEPWRTAISVLYQCFGEDFLKMNIPFLKNLDADKVNLLLQMIDKKINCPLSSGMGRLFDAVSAMCELVQKSGFHAEAPMRLEDAIKKGEQAYYPFELAESIPIKPIVKAVVSDIKAGKAAGLISARFHNTLVKISLQTCLNIRKKTKLNKVVLSGGSFQNKYLSENLINALTEEGFEVFNQQKIPSNDGGISLGQIAIASAWLENKHETIDAEKMDCEKNKINKTKKICV